MKGTEEFKKTIQAYLDNRAAEDTLFLSSYSNPEKNIDDCCNYILAEVKKSGCCGFADAEIFGMAVHYYDEDNIVVSSEKLSGCQVVVNRSIELSESEIDQAKQQAYAEAVEAEQKRLRKKQERKQKTPVEAEGQPTLF